MQTFTITDHLYLATDADGNIWAHKTRGDPILSKVIYVVCFGPGHQGRLTFVPESSLRGRSPSSHGS